MASGILKMAEGGSILLDNVDPLLCLSATACSVLEQRATAVLHGSQDGINIRFIAATHGDLNRWPWKAASVMTSCSI